jgi:fatty-acyl-CoA synthase
MLPLDARIEAAAGRGGSITFKSGDVSVAVGWGQLHAEAKAMAAVLQQRGIAPGDHVALLGPTSRNLVTAIQATWLAGATVMVLPIPMRLGSIEDFIAQTRIRIRRGHAALFVIDDDFADFVEREEGDPPFATFGDLGPGEGRATAADWQRPPVDLDRLAVLQFTSGSTADPKGVMLAHRTVCSNIDAMAEAIDFDPSVDVLVSWLPLYHDMGLIGILTSGMTLGSDVVLGAPQDFMARPARWMEWMSEHRGSVTAGPNFAWALAARSLKRRDDTLDLSPLRMALNGAEPIDATTVEALVEAGAAHGMDPGAIFPAFGMAELAIAGCFPPIGRGLVLDTVDRRVLETERYAAPVEPGTDGSRSFARLGFPVPGLQIRVCDPETGRERAEREVGELEIRGTSVMPGYYENPLANAAAFRGDWFRTGDLAYLVEGELVLCGRIKDVIILGGRNIFPDDIERAVCEVEGVRAGNVIAFGAPGARGKESVVVVAETKLEGDDLVELRKAVHKRALEVSGVPPHDVVLLAPGALPKTSSGKLQRARCKQLFLAGDLDAVAALS